ncbi:hypothetical protein CsSME_00022032 [Camellia sinensis var. sinensis]
MQSLSPPSISLKSIIGTRTLSPTNNSANSNFCGGVGCNRADWQSSCAILASKVVSQQQDTTVKSGNADNITAVNGHQTLDLVPIENLPKPLTITDLSPAPMHGADLRVAYQGVPRAYSEAAASKASPNCEAIPCDQFEVAFQAIKLWIADRAVLPVENSLGGSIHRNYDLLLRHRPLTSTALLSHSSSRPELSGIDLSLSLSLSHFTSTLSIRQTDFLSFSL